MGTIKMERYLIARVYQESWFFSHVLYRLHIGNQGFILITHHSDKYHKLKRKIWEVD